MSATRVKHQEWAEAFISDAQQPFDPNEPTHDGRDATVAENLAFAQVHATLALVEQQRIANLLAVYSATRLNEDGTRVATRPDLADRAFGIVLEALGLS